MGLLGAKTCVDVEVPGCLALVTFFPPNPAQCPEVGQSHETTASPRHENPMGEKRRIERHHPTEGPRGSNRFALGRGKQKSRPLDKGDGGSKGASHRTGKPCNPASGRQERGLWVVPGAPLHLRTQKHCSSCEPGAGHTHLAQPKTNRRVQRSQACCKSDANAS